MSSLHSNKNKRNEDQYFDNMFLNKSYPLKANNSLKININKTPEPLSKHHSYMLSINKVDDNGNKILVDDANLSKILLNVNSSKSK